MTKQEIMTKFYDAFSKGDYETMNSLYHKKVVFNDAIFTDLDYEYVTHMWEMLLKGNIDMKVTYKIVDEKDGDIKVNWLADYHFGPKRRFVHNDTLAMMEIKDDKIIKHADVFAFSAWSRQSLGFTGKLFGRRKWMHKKVSKTAREKLDNYIKNNK